MEGSVVSGALSGSAAASDCLLVQLFSDSLCRVQMLPAASDSLQVQLFQTACVRLSCFGQHQTVVPGSLGSSAAFFKFPVPY
jgi:hypothetical protein